MLGSAERSSPNLISHKILRNIPTYVTTIPQGHPHRRVEGRLAVQYRSIAR